MLTILGKEAVHEMYDSEVKWNDAPIPISSTFFTADAYEKYTISTSFGERLVALDADIQSAAKASERATKQSAAKPQASTKDVIVKKTAVKAKSSEPATNTGSPETNSQQLSASRQSATATLAGQATCKTANKKNPPNVKQSNQTGRSKKLTPPHYSILTSAEQKAYLELYQKYSKFIPTNPNKSEVKDIQKFKDLQIRVQAEQQEFQDYLERAAYHMPEAYQYMHPDASQFIQEWLDVHRARVYKYPRYYVVQDSVSLEPPKILRQAPLFQHIQTLLQVGEVPRAILPNMNMKIRSRVPTDYKKLKKYHPLLPGSVSKKVCSQDKNLEKLAQKYGAKIVMSSSSLQCLLDNQTLDKVWELPVTVKSYRREENGQEVTDKLVYVDKPFPKQNMNEYEKNLHFYKLAVKAYLLHPGHQKSLKFSKFNQTEPPLQRVLETTAQESCFDVGDVDIADLETFGLLDKSPSRTPKPSGTSEMKEMAEDCTNEISETLTDTQEVGTENTAESLGVSTDHVAHVKETTNGALTTCMDNKESVDGKTLEKERAWISEPAEDASSPSVASQPRRSSRRQGSASNSQQTSSHQGPDEPQKSEDAEIHQGIAEKSSAQNKNSEEIDSSCKKLKLSKSLDSGSGSEISPSARVTRLSGRLFGPQEILSDESKAENKTTTRRSLRVSADRSPARKAESIGSNSDTDNSVKGKKDLLSLGSPSDSDEDSTLVIDEPKEEAQKDKPLKATPRMTRRSSGRLSLAKDPELRKQLESNLKKISSKRNLRTSSEHFSSDSESGSVKQIAAKSKTERSSANAFTGSQTDSEDEDDKLIIDEPKTEVSGMEGETKRKASSSSPRATRSRGSSFSESKQSSPSVTTRRSKRLSSEPIDDIRQENAQSPKRTRSRGSSVVKADEPSYAPEEIAKSEPERGHEMEIISPASPPSEIPEVEVSPASPTMTDDADKPFPHLTIGAGNQPDGGTIKEIPLSPLGPLSPPLKMETDDQSALKERDTSVSEVEKSPASAEHGSTKKNMKSESAFDSILKAQTVMLQTSKPAQPVKENVSAVGILSPQSSKILAKGADWIAAENPTDYQSPEDHNSTYNLWQLGNIPLVVRCSLHGNIRDKKQNMSYISINPKLEYQYPYGVEQLTSSDICKAWISSNLRSNCSTVRARINVSNSDVVLIERLHAHQVVPPRSAFNPDAALTVLYNIVESLLKLSEGNYLLSHTQDNTHAHIKKSVDRKGGVYDLHAAHTTFADTEPSGSPVVWVPVDPTIILPTHKFAGRVPATFDPKDGQKKRNFQAPQKKKKKKKKTKPQN